MEEKKLGGQVTVITGASSGMGAAIARRFAGEGSNVVLSARRVDRLQKLANEISSDGVETLVEPADVSDYAEMKNLIEKTIEVFGRIDVMVNGAGFGVLKPFLVCLNCDNSV